ncbi:hypothetical protein EG834_05620, partial [bacterium]|nr:hypothetical protein [bacterium]
MLERVSHELPLTFGSTRRIAQALIAPEQGRRQCCVSARGVVALWLNTVRRRPSFFDAPSFSIRFCIAVKLPVDEGGGMKRLLRFVVILIAFGWVLPASAQIPTDEENSDTTPSLGGLLIYDRDFKHNATPFSLTNETTITVELIGVRSRIESLYLAEDDQLTSNVQAHYRRPLGNYDGGTTFTFTLTPENGVRTIWAIAQNRTEYISPPTSGTITLDTIPPTFNLAFSKHKGDVRVEVTFSEDVHEFDTDDIEIGGGGGVVMRFSGKGSHYVFWITPNNSKTVRIGIHADDIWDLAGNPAASPASVNMAPAVEEINLPSLTMMGSSESNYFVGNDESNDFETLTAIDVWVDFYWTNLTRNGSEANPYNNITEGVAYANAGDTINIEPGASPERLRITKQLRIEAPNGPARIGGAGCLAYGRVLRWYDPTGNVIAWMDENGRFYTTGAIHTSQGLLTGQYVWSVIDGSGTHAGMTANGDLYLQGGFSTNPSTGHLFYVSDPNNMSSALASISSDGAMHLRDSSSSYAWQNCALRGPENIPSTVTAHSVSPLFPTPNYWRDLPARYQTYLNQDSILTT